MIVIKNVLLLTAVVLILSVQALLLAASVVQIYPPQGEREMGFFWFFVVIAVGLQIGALNLFKDRLEDRAFGDRLRSFFWTEAVLLAFLLSAWWKIIVYDRYPQLAQAAYYIVLAACVLNKIFWSRIHRWGQEAFGFVSDAQNRSLLRRLADPLFLILIVLLIYVPDQQAALAKMFVGEQFHHFDNVIMGPTWAVASGNLIYVDNISQYGLGMPIVISRLAELFGGYSYESVFAVIMWICIIYYLLFYLLLRYWNRSVLLSMAALLVAIKVQLFYSFSYPMTFTYPNGTILRSCFDIFFMAALLAHIKTHRPVFLLAAGAVTGFSVFYIFTTGVDMALALYAYLAMHLITPHYRQYVYKSAKDLGRVAAYFILPLALALALIWLAVGHHAGTKEFWQNVFDFPKLFTLGIFKERFFRGLEVQHFWDVAFGCLFPAVYVLSMTFIGILFYWGRGRYQDIFILALCVYGLSMYHHYAAMAVGNNYYMRAIPFVFVIFHWVNVLLGFLLPSARMKAAMVLTAFTAFCLLTNHDFISHPNFLNFSRNPFTDPLVARPLPEDGRPYYHHQFAFVAEDFKLPVNSFGDKDERLIDRSDYFANDGQIKEYARREFDFSQDAALIDRLTSGRQKVALVSSFDVKILMQAHRRPYFYFFPFLNSRPMYMRIFSGANMFTKPHVQKVLGQLAYDPPEYIFMERIYLNRDLPARYSVDLEELLPVLDYIYGHYEPDQYGHYLVAMKRRP